MRPYSFKLAASTSDAFNVVAEGNYVRYRKCTVGTGDPEILIETNKGDLIPLLPGEDANLGATCELFKVKSMNGTVAIEGVLMIAGGFDGVKTSSDRITGEVAVIDGAKADTIGGAAFLGFASKGAAGAGQYSHIQLLNPLGSSKRIILTAWLANVLSASNGSMYLTLYNTALGTLVGNGSSKYSGGSASVAEIRTGSDVGGLGTQIFSKAGQGICAIDMSQWKQPIVLPPGKGVCAFWDVANIGISSSPEWKEETNS